MNTLRGSIEQGGKSTTVWLSVVTMFLSLSAMPEFGKLLPQEALPYMVIMIAIAEGIKRVLTAGGQSSTPYLAAIQAALAVLSLPTWAQVLPPSALPYLVTVISAITWYKRMFFPTYLEPVQISNVSPNAEIQAIQNAPVDVIVKEAMHRIGSKLEP